MLFNLIGFRVRLFKQFKKAGILNRWFYNHLFCSDYDKYVDKLYYKFIMCKSELTLDDCRELYCCLDALGVKPAIVYVEILRTQRLINKEFHKKLDTVFMDSEKYVYSSNMDDEVFYTHQASFDDRFKYILRYIDFEYATKYIGTRYPELYEVKDKIAFWVSGGINKSKPQLYREGFNKASIDDMKGNFIKASKEVCKTEVFMLDNNPIYAVDAYLEYNPQFLHDECKKKMQISVEGESLYLDEGEWFTITEDLELSKVNNIVMKNVIKIIENGIKS